MLLASGSEVGHLAPGQVCSAHGCSFCSDNIFLSGFGCLFPLAPHLQSSVLPFILHAVVMPLCPKYYSNKFTLPSTLLACICVRVRAHTHTHTQSRLHNRPSCDPVSGSLCPLPRSPLSPGTQPSLTVRCMHKLSCLWAVRPSLLSPLHLSSRSLFDVIYLFILLFKATPPACGGSQARGLIGVSSELQLPAYTTATAMWDPSRVCNPHRSSWHCRILKPLSEARDRTCDLMVPSRIRFRGTTKGTPSMCTFSLGTGLNQGITTVAFSTKICHKHCNCDRTADGKAQKVKEGRN